MLRGGGRRGCRPAARCPSPSGGRCPRTPSIARRSGADEGEGRILFSGWKPCETNDLAFFLPHLSRSDILPRWGRNDPPALCSHRRGDPCGRPSQAPSPREFSFAPLASPHVGERCREATERGRLAFPSGEGGSGLPAARNRKGSSRSLVGADVLGGSPKVFPAHGEGGPEALSLRTSAHTGVAIRLFCPATRVSLSFACPKERDQRKRHQGGEDFVFSPSLDPPSFKRPNGACEPLLDFPGNTNPVSLWGAGVLDSPLSSRRRGGITMRQPKPSPHTGKGDRWRWMRSPRSGLRIHLRRVRWGGRRALSHLKVFTTVLSQCLRNILRIV